jgi:hypothetical protein
MPGMGKGEREIVEIGRRPVKRETGKGRDAVAQKCGYSAFPTRAGAGLSSPKTSTAGPPATRPHLGPTTTPTNDPSLQAIQVGKYGRPPYPHHRKRYAN